MVNLNTSLHQGDKDGKNSYLSLDVLNREDATQMEYKLIKALEKHMFDVVKAMPQFDLKDTKTLHMMEYNKEESS